MRNLGELARTVNDLRARLPALLDLPAELGELARTVNDLRARLLDTLDWIRRPPSKPRVSVVVLWTGEPHCASRAGELGTLLQFRCDFPIPAGAWVVGIGCELGCVFVGHHLQNVCGADGGGPVLRLTDTVHLGMTLRVQTR